MIKTNPQHPIIIVASRWRAVYKYYSFIIRGRDNRETVFLTEPVADLAHIIVNSLVALICVVVHEVNRIENQVVMNMVFVNVSGQHKPCVYGYDCRHAALFPVRHV